MNLLQTLDLDCRPEVERLYFNVIKADETSIDRFPSRDGDRLHIPAGTSVSFDSYFNSFFENYWFQYTHLSSAHLRLRLEGDCVVSIHRQTPHRDVYLLDRLSPVDGIVEFELDDEDELRVEAGRVWFTILATTDVELSDGGWFTNEEPARAVSLAAVFCTFNRQQYLQRILKALAAHPGAVASLSKLFIVNQGDSFTSEEILGGPGSNLESIVHLIEQPNMGGCGGFTRGMYETWRDDDLTHFVLLDDDSRVHPDSLLRTSTFLSYAYDDVVVGGHMLNLHRPNFLFEAGAELDAETLQPQPLINDEFIGDEAGLSALLRPGSVEYNGWWFFGAPKRVLDEVGFPMPCFIRGDDIEFGMRLKRNGWRTIPVPGIAVWHEPFYLKLGSWQLFFEVRNRLAAATLHDAGSWSAIRRDLLAVFTRDISMSRYHSAQLMIDAISDYLAGPEVCLQTDNEALQRARKVVTELGPTQVEVPGIIASKAERLAKAGDIRRVGYKVLDEGERRLGKFALGAHVARRQLQPSGDRIGGPVFRAADIQPHRAAAADRYTVVEEHNAIAWLHERDREIERKLWSQFRPLLQRVGPIDSYIEQRQQTIGWRTFWQHLFED